ncbi:hypothetical protein OROGR_016212 [Orobanche gracilis]
MKVWGFRRCEDICWVKTNKTNATPGLRHDSHTLFQRSKEHCLMGIKGTVRRSTDGHIIHANIVCVIPGSTAKPEDMYRIVEHFALGRRRLELFGADHNIRSGWLTVGKELSSSNFNSENTSRVSAEGELTCCYDNHIDRCIPGLDNRKCDQMCKQNCSKGGFCKVFNHKPPNHYCHCYC